MVQIVLAALLASPVAAHAALPAKEKAAAPVSAPAALSSPAAAPGPLAPPSTLEQPLALTDEIIRKAVRETVAETPAKPDSVVLNENAYSANSPYSKLGAAFDEAKVPDCLHGDALKLQPARIGPIGVVGPLSLPWVIAAVIRGKCR